MTKNTSNIDLVKPGVDEFYDVNIMNSNLDKIDSYTGEIKNKIYNGSIQNTNLQLGCNRIQIPEISVSPKIEFTGFSYVNLLGRDGNCEDTSKWNTYLSTLSLDITNKVFGSKCIKTVSEGYFTAINKTSLKNHIGGKKVFISVYIKTNVPDVVRIRFSNYNGGGSAPYTRTTNINSTATMTRFGVKLDLTDSASNELYLWIFKETPTATEMYMDGVMVNVITDDEYANISEANLLAKYPYVDSYGCLTNPYFENRRYNLVRNGNCEEGIGYWNSSGNITIQVKNDKFKLESAIAWSACYQLIKVKPNTDYYLTGNASTTAGIFIYNSNLSLLIKSGAGTFNSGTNDVISVLLSVGVTPGTFYFDSIMLVEGTAAPTEYKSCDLQRFVVEGQFTADDKVSVENGKISGLLNWKQPAPLYGKDYDWQFGADYTGFKRFNIPNARAIFSGIQQNENATDHVDMCVVKYDGKILPQGNTASAPDLSHSYASGNTFFISAVDTDSGWGELINPNNDEVKAFMNGWEALLYEESNSRYTVWGNKLKHGALATDIMAYPTGSATTLTVATTAGATSITVADASIFKTGDRICIYGMGYVVITNIVGNVITVNMGVVAYPIGRVVMRSDNPTAGDTRLLQYCKTNIAPGYEGYKLHYKLANPEPITDTNVLVEGEIWDLVKGDNYITVDSGIVLGEVANIGTDANLAAINEIGTNRPNSPLKNKVGVINAIYRNSILNTSLWNIEYNTTTTYGEFKAYTALANFDTSATFTVDYQILKTAHIHTFGSLLLSYPQSIISTLEGHGKALEQRQAKDSTLDSLIDLSLYEHIQYKGAIFLPWLQGSTYFYLGTYIPFKVVKKVVPVVKIVNYRLSTQSGVVDKSVAQMYISSVSAAGLTFEIRIAPANTAVISNIKSYGAYIVDFELEFDCRGRI